MSQLVQLDDRARAVQHVFTVNAQAMARTVPRTLGDPARLIRVAYNSVAFDPLLLETSKTPQGMASIMGGVMEALKLGLTIGGPAQEAFLVPFRQHGTLEAVLIIGYQGFRNILDRSRSVIDLHPRAVFENDEFDVNFGTQKVFHKPYWLVGKTEAGPLVAVYAIAHLARGGIQIEVMPKSEVDEHRARSRAKDAGPWVTDYVAMALKTVVRKIAKYLPKSSEILMRALDLDQKADLGVVQDFDMEGLLLDEGPPPSRQVGSSALDKLKKTLPKPPTEPQPPGPPQTTGTQLTEEPKTELAKTATGTQGTIAPNILHLDAQMKAHFEDCRGAKSASPANTAPPLRAGVTEEALRELDEALATLTDDDSETRPCREVADQIRRADAEVDSRAGHLLREMPEADSRAQPGTLFEGAPTAAADFAGKVEAVRKRAEELARRKRT